MDCSLVSDRLALYNRLPYPLRCLVASARGHQLRRWRYGPETEALVQQALEREAWGAREWKLWQEERLGFVLDRAATTVPYYRDLWSRRRRRGDRRSHEELSNWPVLDKEALRNAPEAFVADDRNTKHMFLLHTSGTSGKPLTLWRTREVDRHWYALFEARNLNWNGVSRFQRWAMLGGQLVTPAQQSAPPFWVRNESMKQLYMSSYHLGPTTAASYAEALCRFRPQFLWGYASSLFTLAQFALERGLELPDVRVAISNAEPLFDHQRRTIAAAFGCPTRATYGMAEIVSAGSECSCGFLHEWPEVGITEIVRDGGEERAAAGESGRMICTGLLNADMPLIRYDAGDRAACVESKVRCECGRLLPQLHDLEGRVDDVLVTPSGRHIGRLDPVFKADFCIREAQIIQETRETIRVLVVPASGYSDQDGNRITEALTRRVGDMDIVVERVEQIPRSAGGKFRAVVNRTAS